MCPYTAQCTVTPIYVIVCLCPITLIYSIAKGFYKAGYFETIPTNYLQRDHEVYKVKGICFTSVFEPQISLLFNLLPSDLDTILGHVH